MCLPKQHGNTGEQGKEGSVRLEWAVTVLPARASRSHLVWEPVSVREAEWNFYFKIALFKVFQYYKQCSNEHVHGEGGLFPRFPLVSSIKQ